MRDPIIHSVLTHWESLRDGRIAPKRSELDPREIRDALDHTFILERVRYTDLRFRLVGAEINNLMGMELRAMPASSLIYPDDRVIFKSMMGEFFERPDILELRILCPSEGKTVQGRMLLLPMLDRENRINRVIGCVSVTGNLSKRPIRFRIMDIAKTRIIPHTPLDHEKKPLGFAEFSTPFIHSKTEGFVPSRPKRRPPSLRLIKGDQI